MPRYPAFYVPAHSRVATSVKSSRHRSATRSPRVGTLSLEIVKSRDRVGLQSLTHASRRTGRYVASFKLHRFKDRQLADND